MAGSVRQTGGRGGRSRRATTVSAVGHGPGAAPRRAGPVHGSYSSFSAATSGEDVNTTFWTVAVIPAVGSSLR